MQAPNGSVIIVCTVRELTRKVVCIIAAEVPLLKSPTAFLVVSMVAIAGSMYVGAQSSSPQGAPKSIHICETFQNLSRLSRMARMRT